MGGVDLLVEIQFRVGGEVGLLCSVEQVPKLAHNDSIQGTAESDEPPLRGCVGGCCVSYAISERLLLFHHVRLLPHFGLSVEHPSLAWGAIIPGTECITAEVRHHGRHAKPNTTSNVVRGKRAFVGVTGVGWDVVGVRNLAQTGGRGYSYWHCGLHHVRLHHVAPVHAHAMRCKPHVCGIDQDLSANEALDQVGGILHSPSAPFPRIGVFQEVDHRGCLLLLEECDDVDHVDHVEEVLGAGVIDALSLAHSANALALLGCA